MKKLVLVNGTMGVGKSSVCRALLELLTPGVYLDGDWCWNMNPFVVSEENKAMVLQNIAYLLNSFLKNSGYEYIIFCWVMHQEQICTELLEKLNGKYELFRFTLTCREKALRERLLKDVEAGLRAPDTIVRSAERLGCYTGMDTVKIDVGDISAAQAAGRISEIVKGSR